MNAISKCVLVLVLLSGAAYAQVPLTNDTSDGNNNTGLGSGALGGPESLNGGADNTAVGSGALLSTTTGGNANTGIGDNALESNVTGGYNTAAGISAYSALAFNTVSFNTATGAFALENNTTGSFNTGFGYAALVGSDSSKGTGSYNTGVRGQPLSCFGAAPESVVGSALRKAARTAAAPILQKSAWLSALSNSSRCGLPHGRHLMVTLTWRHGAEICRVRSA